MGPPPGAGTSPSGPGGVAPSVPAEAAATTTDIERVHDDTSKQSYDNAQAYDGEGEKTIAWREEKLEPALDGDVRRADGGVSHGGHSSCGGKGVSASEDEDEGGKGGSGFVAFGKKLGELFGVLTPKGRPAGLKWRSASWFITAVVAVGVTMDVLAYVSGNAERG